MLSDELPKRRIALCRQKAEMVLHGIEIAVIIEQAVVIFDAECGDDNV